MTGNDARRARGDGSGGRLLRRAPSAQKRRPLRPPKPPREPECFLVVKANERPDPERPSEWTVFDAVRADTGETVASGLTHWWSAGHEGVPPGAMFFVELSEHHRPADENDWPADGSFHKPRPDSKRGPSRTFHDGPNLHVVCPDGAVWNIDARASNCSLPFDYEHRCWVREGDPPNVTVGKGGLTCTAGAGSIQTGSYHGFLRAGRFVLA